MVLVQPTDLSTSAIPDNRRRLNRSQKLHCKFENKNKTAEDFNRNDFIKLTKTDIPADNGQSDHAGCICERVGTPLIRSQNPTGISNATIGSHI